jgi:carbohydrate kinase (thermoresistant glucokinase family)
MVYIMMGVSGSGKTAVGMALAQRLNLPFHDGDAFHPAGNVSKMSAGIPLDDADREPWLEILAGKIREWNQSGGAVLACSALKEKYRETLRRGGDTRFVLLEAPRKVIAERLRHRTEHFMPPSLLDSQFAALEIPADAIHIATESSVQESVADILAALCD